MPQWLLWRYEWIADRSKWTKPPRRLNGSKASSTDANSRYSFDAVLEAKGRNANYDGIGFVLTADDDIVGIDLDHCIDEFGSVDPRARRILEELDSYSEISPSGTGLRILARGKLPPGRRKVGNIEMYDSGRYVTITGNRIDQFSWEVQERQGAISTFHAREFTPTASEPALPRLRVAGNDEDIIERARRARNGDRFVALFDRGDLTQYEGDHSRADLALCGMLAFWLGPDEQYIDAAFRRSALMRSKWDERHGELTYGAMTMAEAISSARETYNARAGSVDDSASPALKPRTQLPRIESASIVSLEPIEVIDYDIESILPASDAPALMFGPPAALKSWLALGICDAVVRGVPFIGLSTRKRPSALYLNLDAGAKTFKNRVRAISDASGFDFVSFASAEYSHDVLRALLAQYRGGFVVIDCLSSIYNPDMRNDPAFAMRGFVDNLRTLYAEYDCGGIVIDHPHRPKERGELGDYHGSIQKEAAFRTMWSIAAEAPAEESPTRRTKIVCRKLSEGTPFAAIDVDITFGTRVSMSRAAEVDIATRASLVETRLLEWALRQSVAFSRRTVVDKVRGQSASATREGFDALVDAGKIVPTGAKRGNGELFRHIDSDGVGASGSRVQTQPDPPDPLTSGGVSGGGSGSPILIGDPPSQTHSQTHPTDPRDQNSKVAAAS